jgi:hypothetical protein
MADKPSTWICKRRGVTVLRQRFAIFDGIAHLQPAQRRRGIPVAQLDNVHSVLRLNYETLRRPIFIGLAERRKTCRL